MDNREIFEIDEVAETKQKVTAGRVAHLTASIILLIAATLVIAFAVYIGVSFFITHAEHEALAAAGENQLGTGLGLAILLAVYLVAAFVGVVLSIISLVLSITVIKFRVGREKVFGIVSVIGNGVYIISALGIFLTMLLVL